MSKRYKLPEEDREYLRRPEMNSLKWCIQAMCSVSDAKKDLAKRLECIPNGTARWRLMSAQLDALIEDIFGTVPRKQGEAAKNMMTDMKVQMVPALASSPGRCTVDVDDLTYVVDHAKKDVCIACLGTEEEYRKCEMFKTLMNLCSIENWDDKGTCPYWTDKWWDN